MPNAGGPRLRQAQARSLALTMILLIAGLAHRSTVNSDRRALQDAIARGQAYIGTNAPGRSAPTSSGPAPLSCSPR